MRMGECSVVCVAEVRRGTKRLLLYISLMRRVCLRRRRRLLLLLVLESHRRLVAVESLCRNSCWTRWRGLTWLSR